MDLFTITEKIKDVISKDIGNRRVRDKDVATILGIKQATFAVNKARNRIPFKEIALFCASRKISMNWLLFGQQTASLQQNQF